jgi:hypothetical protein
MLGMDVLDYDTNASKIKDWRRQKKNNEVQLARKLLKIFEEYPLKNIVQAGFGMIDDRRQEAC